MKSVAASCLRLEASFFSLENTPNLHVSYLLCCAEQNNASSEALLKNSSTLTSAQVYRLFVRKAAKELPEN